MPDTATAETPPAASAPPAAAPEARIRERYYGWVMVGLAAVAMAATLPGRTHGLGLITKHLLDDTAITQATFARMNLWATLIGAAFCVPCGWLIDRVGMRHLLGAVVLALGAVVLWLSTVREPTALFAAITLTRGIGQSMLSVISIAMVGKWFSRSIGPAMGLYSVLTAMLMAGLIGVVGHGIITLGWREAWTAMGWALVFVVAPALWLLTRNHPSDPEREFGSSASSDATEGDTGLPSATLTQALATPCFWVFALSISFFGMQTSGLSLFNQYVLAERGFDESVYHTVLIVGMLVGMVANLVGGYLSRRVRLQRLLAVAMVLLAAASLAFPFAREVWHAYAYAVINGAAGGLLTVLFFEVWGHAYGALRVGTIQSAAQMMTVLASAAGPLVVTASHDATGSYLQVFIGSAVICGVFASVAWLTPVPSARENAWGAGTTR